MSADPARGPHWETRDDALLPHDLTAVLAPRMCAHFGVGPAAMQVSPTRTYSDGSGAVAVFSVPDLDGAPRQRLGRAEMIVISVIAIEDGPADLPLESIREEYDHPGVRVIPLEAHGWTVAYSVIVDAGSSYVGGAVMRFVKLSGSAALSVTLSGVHGPLDHDEARSVAHAILLATGRADDVVRSAVGS